jgi:protein O-mannosyl-transferase
MPAPTTKRPPVNVQRWRVAGICLALAAITFAVFGQTLHHEFVNFDDEKYVYENPAVTKGLTLQGIIRAFAEVHAANWHPLTMLSLMADYQLHGLRAGGYHLSNVLLHTAAVIALFLVLRQMTGALWRSAFVAAVFAIHPLRAESVAWVAERKDVLSGLFFMLAIGAYARYARSPWSAARYGLVVLLFAMGLMSKPMLVTLPVVLLLLDYWPLQRMGSRKFSGLVVEKLPLLALSAAACVAAVMVQNEGMHSSGSFSLPHRLSNALVTCMVYLWQMVFPAGLAVFYPYARNGLPAWEVGLAGMLLAGLSVAAFRQRRRQPWLLTGWVWYLVMLLPVVGIIQVGEQAHADRYTYLPQIGIYVAVTWLAAEWGAKLHADRVAIGGLMAGVVGVLMVCAWKQTAYWKNSEILWFHAIACTADNYMAHNNLGHDLLQRGKTDEAIAHFQKMLEIKPGNPEACNNLGNALLQKGQPDEAMAYFQKALEARPDYAEAHYNLGNALLQKGRVEEAIVQYQTTLQINPGDAKAQVNLGNALVQKGSVDEGIVHYQKALQIDPAFAEAHFNLGSAFLRMGRVDEAVAEYQTALKIKPDYAEAQNNLGSALLQKGRVDEAITEYQKALQSSPEYAEAHYNLGSAFLRMGRVDEAIAHYQKALEINPDYVDAHINLGNALLQKGRVDEAMAHFEKALQIAPANPIVLNSLAWVLATSAEAPLRNGNRAVELARQANAITGGTNPIILHTLAAALAEAGRFGDARESVQKAIELARAAGQQDVVEQLKSELQRYEAGLPLHP